VKREEPTTTTGRGERREKREEERREKREERREEKRREKRKKRMEVKRERREFTSFVLLVLLMLVLVLDGAEWKMEWTEEKGEKREREWGEEKWVKERGEERRTNFSVGEEENRPQFVWRREGGRERGREGTAVSKWW